MYVAIATAAYGNGDADDDTVSVPTMTVFCKSAIQLLIKVYKAQAARTDDSVKRAASTKTAVDNIGVRGVPPARRSQGAQCLAVQRGTQRVRLLTDMQPSS